MEIYQYIVASIMFVNMVLPIILKDSNVFSCSMGWLLALVGYVGWSLGL